MVMQKCFHFTTYTSLTESRDNMKPLLIAIFLLATACAEEPEVFSGPYLTKDGVLFDQETNQAITGIVLRHYDGGELIAKTEYLSGLRHGVHKFYDLDGQLIERLTYKSGVLNGSYEKFNKYGHLRIAENYDMGKLLDQNGELMTGLVEYKDDKFVTKYRYKNGLKDGYGGLFSGSHEYQTWCYQDGVSLEEDDPYCDETRDNM
jgi:hypothetical protein